MVELLNDVSSRFIAEKPNAKKTEDSADENTSAASGLQQASFEKLGFVRGIAGDGDSDSDSKGKKNTNEVHSPEPSVVSEQNAMYDNLTEDMDAKPLVLDQKAIASLQDKYPHNDAVPDLQKSLTEIVKSGKKVEDLPDELKAQLRVIFNSPTK